MIEIIAINLAPHDAEVKTFAILPCLNFSYGDRSFVIGVFWLSFGLEVRFIR